MAQQHACLELPPEQRNGDSDSEIADEISGKLLISGVANMDAMEYLGMVHREASTLPDTFIYDGHVRTEERRDDSFEPIEGTVVSANILVSGRTDLVPCPSQSLLPQSSSWTKNRLVDFEVLHNFLEKCSKLGVGGKEFPRVCVPGLKEREGWHEFCLGKDEAEGNFIGFYDSDSSSNNKNSSSCSSNNDKDSYNAPTWAENIPEDGHIPSVRLLLQLDQVMTLRILSHLSYFLVDEDWPATKKRLLWIYALLARLCKPLLGNDEATLRKLLRGCTKKRAQMQSRNDNDSSILASLNLIIIILAFHFQQGDDSVMKVESSS